MGQAVKLGACGLWAVGPPAWSSGVAGYLMRELLSVSGIPAQPEI
jgi:hypothetical protein